MITIKIGFSFIDWPWAFMLLLLDYVAWLDA